jgi:hypothetical protein
MTFSPPLVLPISQQSMHAKLPLPKWCFILIGIPTFCIPLAYIGWAFQPVQEVSLAVCAQYKIPLAV